MPSRLRNAWNALVGRATPPAGGSGHGPIGPGYGGGYGDRREPTAMELVAAYKAIIYTCANLNANGVTRVPLRLYAVTRLGDPALRCANAPVPPSRLREFARRRDPIVARAVAGAQAVDEVLGHPILEALDDPNPEFDRKSLIHTLVRYLDVTGKAYLKPVSNGFGPPAELWPLQPQFVYPVRTGTSAIPSGYRYFNETFKPEDLLRFRHLSLMDPYGDGYGPAQAALAYAGLEDRYSEVQREILSAPRATMLVSPATDTAMGEEERKRLDLDLRRRSVAAPGQPIVSGVRLSAIPLTMTPQDLGGLDVARYNLERIANCFGVPVSLLSSETNLANVEASHRLHAELAIEPRCDLIAAVLTRYARRFDARLFFAFDPCLGEDAENRAKVWDLKLKNGSAVVNEARADDGLAPVPWGDEPWLASSLRQPSEERPQPTGGAQPTDDAGGRSADQAEGEAKPTSLNGAQFTSLVAIATAVTAGQLGPETAKALIAASFPELTPEQINQIIDSAVSFEPDPPPGAAPAEAPSKGEDDGDGDRAFRDQLAAIVERYAGGQGEGEG